MSAQPQSFYFAKCRNILRTSRAAGPTPRGQALLREGCLLIQRPEFLALSPAAQAELKSHYIAALARSSGGLRYG